MLELTGDGLGLLVRAGFGLPDDIAVLPGHGEQTSIGQERATNPFLLELQRQDDTADTATRPPSRGL